MPDPEDPILPSSEEVIIEAEILEVFPPERDPLQIAGRSLPTDSPLNSISNEVLQCYDWEKIENELTALQFQYAYQICGRIGIDRNKKLEICTTISGLGTSHEGSGRCALHDREIIPSATTVSPYLQHLKQYDSVQAIFDEFRKHRRQMRDLEDEMALARMVMANQLKALDKTKLGKNEDTYRNIIAIIDSIRKLRATMAETEKVESSGVTLEAIKAFLWSLSSIIEEEVMDSSLKSRIFSRLESEVSFAQIVY